ncbi:prominin-1-A isoform X3 [Bacillus rossius redtenbacheri]|uniref:prominin-1-A isoform X3 n=1 Tax=Bacillus rossius redtenbacheri TaxID=93214 RepID=UPI002FDE60FD
MPRHGSTRARASRASWWSCLLLAALAGSCAGSEDIQVAVRNLGDALRSSMLRPVNYSEPRLDAGYRAAATFNPRGMGTLYNVTNVFIDLVVREQTFPDELVVAMNESRVDARFAQLHWKLLVQHYAGLVGVAAAGLVFAVVLPLVGLAFCCCRCCGRCGARSEPFEKRRDPCRRVALGVLLSAVTIVVLFGVVCAFVTNQYLEEGVNSYPRKLRTGLQDAELYLDNTDKEFQTYLVTNFGELRSTLLSALSSAGDVVKYELSMLSNATILSNLTAFVTGLKSIKSELGDISGHVGELQTRTTVLNSTLSLVKDNLTENLKHCQSVSECADLVKQVKNLSAADFDTLPSVDNSLESVTKLLEGGGIVTNIQNAIAHFENLSHDIQTNISNKTPEVEKASLDAGEKIKEIANEISQALKDVKTQLRGADNTITQGQKYIDKYARYRYYLCLGISCILLLILFCLTMGLFYGFCGKRPDEYGSDCCTRATGGKFLMAGVAFMFLFSVLLMVLTLVLFLVGVAGHKVVCESLQSPRDSQVFGLIDGRVNIGGMFRFPNSSGGIDTTLSNVIVTCQKNASLYEVLQLSRVIDVSKISHFPTTYNMTNSIADIKRMTFSLNNKDFEILDSLTKQKLRNLSHSFDNINFEAFNKMQDAVVQIDLMNLARDLNNTADILAGKPALDPQIAASLRMQSAKLQRLQETEVLELSRVVRQLKDKTLALQTDMKFNHSSLGEAVESLVTSAGAVESYMKDNGTDSINMLIEEFLNSSVRMVDAFLKRTINNVTGAGRCGPLSQVYSSVVVATCHEALDPLNGFWASIGWSLLLFIPAIILSVKLATLYKKSDPYPGPLVESDYLYDAYADRDNIPLANVHDKKGHHRRYDETYDNSTGYLGDYSAHLGRDRGRGDGRADRGPAAAAHNDGRYSDMAPKYTRLGNWDYPNGNSPRYNSPPLSTEYERPPPYYYPGPGDARR